MGLVRVRAGGRCIEDRTRALPSLLLLKGWDAEGVEGTKHGSAETFTRVQACSISCNDAVCFVDMEGCYPRDVLEPPDRRRASNLLMKKTSREAISREQRTIKE